MNGNKGQAVVELSVLMVLMVIMLKASMEVVRYLETLQKNQAAAYYAAQCWSVEKPRAIKNADDLWTASTSVRTSIEDRLKAFLADDDTTEAEAEFSVNFGIAKNYSRVEVSSKVNIDFPWLENAGKWLRPVKAKVDGEFWPMFTCYEIAKLEE
ncbi:hypothetical protein KAU39_02525 [bacterium]|nr:hypothetical protein [bacterium]